jgi:Domain of unknown function (DUF4920)
MKIILILALSLTTLAVSAQSYHGQKIAENGATPAAELTTKIGSKTELPAKVEGTVESVCKVKGCWMKLNMSNGQTMRVTFRDYGFFVPKDIVGKTVVIEGIARQSTTSVAMLRHYAEDAGKPKAEIEKITEPEKAMTFVADGVIVK